MVAAEAPHSPVQMIIYGICKMLNIPTYHLVQNMQAPVVHIQKDLYGTSIKKTNYKTDEEMIKILYDYVDSLRSKIPEPLYMKRQNDFDNKKFKNISLLMSHVKSLIKHNHLNKSHLYYFYDKFFEKNRMTVNSFFEIKKIKKLLKRYYEKYVENIDLTESYIYFPLNYEPERTSNPDGGEFYNVYDAITALRSFVPKDIKIFIKEHPSQFSDSLKGYQGRSHLFYLTISQLENVSLVPLKYSSEVLIQKASAVASLTGTACMEAAVRGKKSILFGSPWFKGMPNIYSFDLLESFEAFQHYPISEPESIKDYIQKYIDFFAIEGFASPGSEMYFKSKIDYKLFKKIINNDKMARSVVALIIQDFEEHYRKCHMVT